MKGEKGLSHNFFFNFGVERAPSTRYAPKKVLLERFLIMSARRFAFRHEEVSLETPNLK